ncbi:hypothetical protein RHSIM_Rhsim09G0027600 [Rhododendron simsii]|uniref:ABC transporter domain-containing protein n=1 Tax=Rhododendron simsii TaxID=118357 RepID=A0A834LF69_RHOSS|nr:hypothetical protein RHSIM_Rhsim09G0027600 [Rhododendron simsii]
MENPHGPASFWTQTDALFRKNLVLQKRRKKETCQLLLFPAILCTLLYLLKFFLSRGAKLDNAFPPGYVCSDVEQVHNFTKCLIPWPHEFPPLLQIPESRDRAVRTAFLPSEDLPDGSCKQTSSCPVTVLVTGSNKSLVLDLAGRFFPRSSILNTSDILNGFADGVFGFRLWRSSSSEINDQIFKGDRDGNSERLTNEIIAAYDLLNSNDKKFNTSVWYKSVMKEGDQGKNSMMRVARSVNLVSNAYLEHLRGTDFKILFEFVKEMPKHPDSSSAAMDDLIAMFSTIFFVWIVLQLIPVILTNLVHEKQENIRIMTKMHGLGDGPYSLISYIYFLGISSAYMFCFSASCLFLVVAYLIVFATGLVGIRYFQDKVDDPSFPRNLVIVLELYPGLALYRVFHEFSVKAREARLSHTSGMTWEDLNDRSNGMKEVLIIMVVEWLAFVFVSYCLDDKSSIFCFRRTPNPSSQRTFSSDFGSAENDDITQERVKVEELRVRPDRTYSIICDNLRKVYPGMDGNPQKVAVHGLSLALARGECFGMLGPNGAGKSSFIKMMTGLTRPSAGTAFVEGLNIQTEMERVYTSMGFCPQHDLLWETLSAREHLLFYGRLKNLKGPALHRAVEESLSSVNLLNGGVADKQAGKYSGGMKRRLSVAISLIGDPKHANIIHVNLSYNKVVYMDEPSTGLDPASRNELWKVVMRAKRNRCIGNAKQVSKPPLRSLAEVGEGKNLKPRSRRSSTTFAGRRRVKPDYEYLSEVSLEREETRRSLIEGRRCQEETMSGATRTMKFPDTKIENPVEDKNNLQGARTILKARYGGFYVFTITTSPDHEQEVETSVRRLSPSANKTYHLSGTQKFELSKNEVKIADMLEIVEDAKSKFNVQAWGIADTTLEDVFIKVARGAEAFNVV